MNLSIRSCILFLGLCWASLCYGQGAVSFVIEGAPAIQRMEEQEAVLSNGFQSALLPQVGFRLEYQFWEYFGLRVGAQYLGKGARIPVTSTDFPDAPAGTGKAILQANYMVVQGGLFVRVPLNDKFWAHGFADFAGGYYLSGVTRNSLYPRSHPSYKTPLTSFFNNAYIGIHLGGGLEYKLTEAIALQLKPTLEFQLNNAFRSAVFIPRFVGLAPVLGLRYIFP